MNQSIIEIDREAVVSITIDKVENYSSSVYKSNTVITHPDWNHFPDLKRKLFKEMFPDAPDIFFELCEGKIKCKIV